MNCSKLLTFFLFFTIIFINSCAKTKYSDLKSFINDIIEIQNEYIENLKEAETADDYKDALVDFAEDMIDLENDINAIKNKYPEIKNSNELPSDIISLLDKFKEKRISTEKISLELFNPAKINQFTDDEEFKSVMKKFGKIMKTLDYLYSN